MPLLRRASSVSPQREQLLVMFWNSSFTCLGECGSETSRYRQYLINATRLWRYFLRKRDYRIPHSEGNFNRPRTQSSNPLLGWQRKVHLQRWTWSANLKLDNVLLTHVRSQSFSWAPRKKMLMMQKGYSYSLCNLNRDPSMYNTGQATGTERLHPFLLRWEMVCP